MYVDYQYVTKGVKKYDVKQIDIHVPSMEVR